MMELWKHPLAGVVLRGFGTLFVSLFAWWLAGRVAVILSYLSKKIEERLDKRASRLGLKNTVVSEEAVRTIVETISGLLRIVLLALLVYAWLVAVAYLLDTSHRYVDLVVEPLEKSGRSAFVAITEFLPNLVILVLIVAVGRVLQSVIRAFTKGVALGRVTAFGLDSVLATPTHRILTFFLWVGMVILAAPYLPGAQSKTFQAVSVLLGLLVSFGSSSLVSNLIAGLTLTYARAYRVGDRVRIGDYYGDVVALGVVTTRLRTIKDQEVVLPNGFAHSTPIINYSRYAQGSGVQASVIVTVGYDVPYAIVEALLVRAALATPGIAAEPTPYVLQPEFEGSSLRYEICAFTRVPNELHFIEADLRRRVQDHLYEAGIEICSPSFVAVRDGNAPAIPREEWRRARESVTGSRALDLEAAESRAFRVPASEARSAAKLEARASSKPTGPTGA